MLKLPFYAPDQSFVNNKIGASDYIINLYPLADGYTSVSDFVRVSSTNLKEPVLGTIATVLADASESRFTIIGTTKGLYLVRGETTGDGVTFVDISRENGYNLPVDESWDFAIFGNYIIAVTKNYPPQILDLRQSSNLKFRDLTEIGDIRGTKVAVWGNHLVMIGVLNDNTGYRNQIAWSGLNDPFNWKFTDPASDADEQQFFDGGVVLNATSSKHPLIFARNKIYRGNYVPSSTLVFTFVDISDRIGLRGINSVIEVDDAVYFYSDKGFYRIDANNNITNIGDSIVNEHISRNFTSGSLQNMVVSKDISSTRIIWAISKAFDSGHYDYILIYDYVLNKWSTINRVVQAFLNYTTTGYTLEGLDVLGQLDTLPYSLDSAYWQQNARVVGAIDSEGYLVTMTGKQMEASIRTGVISDNNHGFITMTGAYLDAATDAYKVDVLYTNNKKASHDYKNYFKKYNIPVSRYRDEALFNIRGKYVKLQFNLKGTDTPYSVYNFNYQSRASGYM